MSYVIHYYIFLNYVIRDLFCGQSFQIIQIEIINQIIYKMQPCKFKREKELFKYISMQESMSIYVLLWIISGLIAKDKMRLTLNVLLIFYFFLHVLAVDELSNSERWPFFFFFFMISDINLNFYIRNLMEFIKFYLLLVMFVENFKLNHHLIKERIIQFNYYGMWLKDNII